MEFILRTPLYRLLIFFFFGLASLPVQAEIKPYIAVALGVSSSDVPSAQITQIFMDEGFGSVEGTLDKSAGVIKVMLGVDLNRYLSLETGISNLGMVEASGSTTAPDSSFKLELETTSFEVVAIGNYPLDHYSRVFAKIGLHAWESEMTIRSSGGTQFKSMAESTDGIGATFGGGITYKAWQLEYQHYSLDEIEIDTFQLSYRFML